MRKGINWLLRWIFDRGPDGELDLRLEKNRQALESRRQEFKRESAA